MKTKTLKRNLLMSSDHSPTQPIGLRIRENELAQITNRPDPFLGGQMLQLCSQESIFLQILASGISALSYLSDSGRSQLLRGKMALETKAYEEEKESCSFHISLFQSVRCQQEALATYSCLQPEGLYPENTRAKRSRGKSGDCSH